MRLNRRSLLAGAAMGMASVAGCMGGDDPDDGCVMLPEEPRYGGWMEDTSNYRHTCDFRSEDTVVVTVGVQANDAYWGYGPVAVAVSPGATVRWVWNGRGGAHDVVERDGRFDSGDPVDSETKTFEVTFETPGVFRYYCGPHRSQGMKGAVFVALE